MKSVRMVFCAVLLLLVAGQQKSSLLFIVSDDLRPNLNLAYGQEYMHTPHLDRLANGSCVFDRCYT